MSDESLIPKNNYDDDLIKRYIQNRLLDEELKSFKILLKEDTNLMKEVKFRKEIYHSLNSSSKRNLKRRIELIDNDIKRLKILKSFSVKLVAASFILLGILLSQIQTC